MSSKLDNQLVNLPETSPAKYWQIRVENNGLNEYFEIPEIRVYYRLARLKAR